MQKPDSVKPTLKPLTVLDVAKTADAKTIITAQIALAEQASCAAAAAQELEEVAFAFKKMRLVVGKPSAKEGAPKGDETIAALNKAVSAANCAIFKLRKACWGVGEKVNMTSALIAVLKNLRASVEQKAKDAHKTVLDVLHFKPSVKVADDGALDFDWGIKLELPGVPEFPDCLPVPSKLVHQEVMKLKDTVKELAAKFPELKQKVEALVEESKETFKEPKAKFEAAGLDSMATMKAMTTLGRNTATVATASSQVLGAFVGSVKRVGDELKRAVEEAEKVKEELLK